MKSHTIILLIVAAGCGLVAMLGVKQTLDGQGKEDIPTADVLVASAPINAGEPLTELNVVFKTMPLDSCPEGVVTDMAQVAERSLKVPVVGGDWILASKLSEPGETGAGANIPKGMRVMTIPVDATKNHSGMLRAGNRVDVLLAYKSNEGGRTQEKVTPFLEYIEVFAVDDKVYGVEKSTGGGSKNISLLLTPNQAMLLPLAQSKGQLSIMLRSNSDKDELNSAGVTTADLEANGEVNTTSTLDIRSELGLGLPESGFVLPEMERKPPSVISQLQHEVQGSGPIGEQHTRPPANTWTIAIYEKGGVRVEAVNLDSDEPIPTKKETSSKPSANPVVDELTSGLNPDSDPGSELEEATSGLWDLLK